MKVVAYCLDWHLSNSDAFRDLLAKPLEGKAEVEFVSWDGENIILPKDKTMPLIFCMLPPTKKTMDLKDRRIFWVPMWDQAQGYSDEWWESIPKNIKIIAYSKKIYDKAISSGLTTLKLQYFKNPNNYRQVNWKNGRVLFYWNRVGLVGPDFLVKICNCLDIDLLIFKAEIDPRIDKDRYYEMPEIIGKKTKVQLIHSTKTREEYLDQVANANIVIAPRLYEGVGMVFLEAMAKGCCVIANNAPTMNEYIINGHSGILIDKSEISSGRLLKLLTKKRPGTNKTFFISDKQPWQELSKYDLSLLGNNARAISKQGYDKWSESSKDLLKFIFSS